MLVEDSYNSGKSRNNLLDQTKSHLQERCLSKTATIVPNLGTTCWIKQEAIYEEDAYRRQQQQCQIWEQLAGSNKKPFTRKMLFKDSYNSAKSRNNLLDQTRSHLRGRCLSKAATTVPNLGTTCWIEQEAIYEEHAYRRQLQNCQILEQLAGSKTKSSRRKMLIEDSYNSVKSRNNLLDQKRSHLRGRCVAKKATIVSNLRATCWIKQKAIYEEDAYRRQLQ